MENLELSERLIRVESRCKSNTHRLDTLEKQTEAVNRLATSVEVMAAEQKNMSEHLTEVVSDVKDLKAEPAKKWRFVVEKSIYIIVAALLGFALARLGLC